MLGPMLILLLLCLVAAVVPQSVVDSFAVPLTQILGNPAGSALPEWEAAEAPLYIVGNLNAWTIVALAAVASLLWALSRPTRRATGPTWGCGYVAPTERMQYTARSFAEMIAERLMPRFLRPRTTRQAPRGLFPSKSSFSSESPDPVSEKVYEPFFRGAAERFSRLRILQQGNVHVYLVYILVTVVLALAWVSLRTWRVSS
jgi:hydrogenase-4 component B